MYEKNPEPEKINAVFLFGKIRAGRKTATFKKNKGRFGSARSFYFVKQGY